jgi:uncharacterized coiled-coil DUF342 family protein
MPQDQEALDCELRRQMREGRAPFIEAISAKWENFLLLNKGAVRKADELRDQVGSMNNQFAAKSKQLRNYSRKTASLRERRDSTEGAIALFEALGAQAKAVGELIDKELPKLLKLEKPVEEAYTAYQVALDNYRVYMVGWQGKLPDEDLTDRSLELALDAVEKSLR